MVTLTSWRHVDHLSDGYSFQVTLNMTVDIWSREWRGGHSNEKPIQAPNTILGLLL